MTPNMSSIQRFDPKDGIVPEIATITGGIKELILARELIVRDIGTARDLPRNG
jgi:hypothetical protein